LLAEGVAGRRCEPAENAVLLRAEPDRTRFGRKETIAVQRLKIDAAPVSEVRSDFLNRFETQRNSGADAGRSRVRNLKMAEGVGLISNLLYL